MPINVVGYPDTFTTNHEIAGFIHEAQQQLSERRAQANSTRTHLESLEADCRNLVFEIDSLTQVLANQGERP